LNSNAFHVEDTLTMPSTAPESTWSRRTVTKLSRRESSWTDTERIRIARLRECPSDITGRVYLAPENLKERRRSLTMKMQILRKAQSKIT
jgi:hypothetical protein